MANVKTLKDSLSKRPAGALTSIEVMLQKSAANLGQALPSHMKPERLNRIVLTLLKTTPKLAQCEPLSIVAAVFQMAQIGLEPQDGQAYIIPYAGKASFQIGYKGYVALFYRHALAKSINWGIVCENDAFDWDRGQNILTHKENLKGDRGVPYAYWVKADLTTGGTIIECMSKDAVIKHAKQHSKTYGSGPWQTDFDQMALKTVFIKISKLLPKSVELQQALEFDNTIKTKVDADMAAVPDETNWEDKVETIEIDKEIEVEGRKVLVASADVPDDLDMTPPPPAPKAEKAADDLKNYKTDAQGRLIDPKTGKPI